MTVKQLMGLSSPDGSTYVTITDGAGNLVDLASDPIVVGTTVISGGVSGDLLYNNSNVIGDTSGVSFPGTGRLTLGAAGSLSNPTLTFSNSGTNTGFLAPGANQVQLSVNGSSIWDHNVSSASVFTINELVKVASSLILISGTASLQLRNGGTFISSPNTAVLQLGSVDTASPVAQSFQVQSVITGTSNTAGTTWTFNGSKSTGSGVSGDILFTTGGTGAASTAQNSLVNSLTLKGATQQAVFGGTVKLASYIVSGLPSASTAGAGSTAFVTDASTTLILGLGGPVSGGGSNKVPVYSDGTNWVYG